MARSKSSSCHVSSAVLLTTLLAATTAMAAGDGKGSAGTKERLAAQFQARLAESLLVLVPSDVIEAKAALARNGRVPTAFDELQVPRSSLVMALLAADGYGLGGGAASADADAASGNGASQRRGRRPVSPNGPPGPPHDPPGPPGRPPGPPHDPPGPPHDPPGPPDGKGPKGKAK